MSKHILMVVTNADTLNEGHKTGIWLSEFAEAYLAFEKEGFKITVASPNGGNAPIDPNSLTGEKSDEILKTQSLLKDTLKLSSIKDTTEFDAIFLPGGHGTMMDLPDNKLLHKWINKIDDSNGIVSAVCHGPSGLVGVYKNDGTPFVKGKAITTFTDSEENEAGLSNVVPFMLESRLKELGAIIASGVNWSSTVRQSGNLITGQNPQSTIETAEAVIAALK